jgi:hypothetical protein
MRATKNIILLCLSVLSFSAVADRVVLLDSTEFVGTVKKVSACKVKLNIQGAIVPFKAEEIAYVEFDSQYDRNFEKYLELYKKDANACFSYMQDVNPEKNRRTAKLIGPNHDLNGREGKRMEDVITVSNDDEAAVEAFQIFEMEKRHRRNQMLMSILFGTLVGFIF